MEGILEYNRLPAINSFPQFNRPISILSPLDLSLRTSLIPITPPSTPSPPRKRLRNTEDNINLWRPHSLSYFDSSPFLSWQTDEIKKISEKFDGTNKSNNNNHIHIQNKVIDDCETIVLTEDEGENDESTIEDDDDDEEFVDILSNDDDIPIISLTKISNDDQNCTGVLSKEKLVYEDPKLHNRAIEGFAKLFDKNFITDYEKQSKTVTDKNLVQETSSQQIFRQLMKSKYEKRKFKIRKQLIDEDNSSPVSGTIIRKLRDDEELVVTKGDIDPAFNVVEITDEAKSILASIDNKIGSYICQLCRTMYEDAFQLAQHRCTRIVHIEYRCSECDKVFNCPANLASHRRWHKPKSEVLASQNKKSNAEKITKLIPSGLNACQDDETNSDGAFNCQECGKGFRRQAYLKKHLTSHQILNDFKSLETLKNSTGNYGRSLPYPPPNHNTNLYQSPNTTNLITPNSHHQHHHRIYSGAIRFPPFFPNFDQRNIHPFSDFYFPQNWDRNSAFQYVHNQQHLRGDVNSNGVVQQITPLTVK